MASLSDLYSVGPVKGKGMGVTTTSPLLKGQLVMRERPLIESPARLILSSPSQEAANAYFYEKVEVLSAEQQKAFYSLSDWRSEQEGLTKTAYRVFRSNALPKGHGQAAKGAAVYQTICRINHSCLPSCHYSWNAKRSKEVVHALTEIPVGDELSVTYIELFASHLERQKILQEKFGFLCGCPACTASGNKLQESNERRHLLAALDSQIRDNADSRPKTSLKAVEEFFPLFADEGIVDTYLTARVCRIALDICMRHPDLGNAKHFAEVGLTAFTTCEGADGEGAEVMQGWLSGQVHTE